MREDLNLLSIHGKENLQNYYYCTACIVATEGHSYGFVYDEYFKFLKNHVLGSGCIDFLIVPSNPDEKEFILWKIWKDEEAFKDNLAQQHTKDLFARKIVEIKRVKTAGLGKNYI